MAKNQLSVQLPVSDTSGAVGDVETGKNAGRGNQKFGINFTYRAEIVIGPDCRVSSAFPSSPASSEALFAGLLDRPGNGSY